MRGHRLAFVVFDDSGDEIDPSGASEYISGRVLQFSAPFGHLCVEHGQTVTASEADDLRRALRAVAGDGFSRATAVSRR